MPFGVSILAYLWFQTVHLLLVTVLATDLNCGVTIYKLSITIITVTITKVLQESYFVTVILRHRSLVERSPNSVGRVQ